MRRGWPRESVVRRGHGKTASDQRLRTEWVGYFSQSQGTFLRYYACTSDPGPRAQSILSCPVGGPRSSCDCSRQKRDKIVKRARYCGDRKYICALYCVSREEKTR